MEPAGGVNRRHGIGEAAKELDQAVIGDAATAGHEGFEIAAIEPFEDDEREVAIAAGILQADDAGVVEAGQQLGLPG